MRDVVDAPKATTAEAGAAGADPAWTPTIGQEFQSGSGSAAPGDAGGLFADSGIADLAQRGGLADEFDVVSASPETARDGGR